MVIKQVMSVKFLVGIVLLLPSVCIGQKANKPFPSHSQYAAGTVLLSHKSQQEKDKAVTSFYDAWKKKYVKNDCSDPNLYYIFTDEGDKLAAGPSVVCVSEGQGYGMMIMPLMAGYDKDAQHIYDGMFRFVVQHPTAKSKDLMSWSIASGCATNHHKTSDEYDNTSATDGDLDIALSLFMADAQWGSKGAINYKAEGIKRVKAILNFEVNKQKHTLLLGDANDPGDFDFFDIRTSDFMPTHLKVFNKYLPNPEWQKVVDRTYQIFSEMQAKYSPKAGLIPDFIIYRNKKYTPAKPNYLEGDTDGQYFYNACRVPLRIGLDYIVNGDVRAQKFLTPLCHFFKAKTKGNVKNMYAGYYLNGKAIPKYYYVVPSFMSTLSVGSMAVAGTQNWVNDCWDFVSTFKTKDFQYYDNTVHMLSLIIMSGNYWLP